MAPANGIYSCSNGIKSGYSYVPKSGTSMATPIVSGVICMILGINKENVSTYSARS
ncbi:MAG: S8 family serine peptidase [Eubacterium ventriosum]